MADIDLFNIERTLEEMSKTLQNIHQELKVRNDLDKELQKLVEENFEEKDKSNQPLIKIRGLPSDETL